MSRYRISLPPLVVFLLMPCCVGYAQQITYLSQTRWVEGYNNPGTCNVTAPDFNSFSAQCDGVGPSGGTFMPAASQNSSLTSSGFSVTGTSTGDSFDGVGQSWFEVAFDLDSAANFEFDLQNSQITVFSQLMFMGPNTNYNAEGLNNDSFNIIPAAGLLDPGQYTFKYVDAQGDGSEPFSLEFSINPVPEPAAPITVLLIVGVICVRRRQRA